MEQMTLVWKSQRLDAQLRNSLLVLVHTDLQLGTDSFDIGNKSEHLLIQEFLPARSPVTEHEAAEADM